MNNLSESEMQLIVDAVHDTQCMRKLETERPDLCVYTLDSQFVTDCMLKLYNYYI